MPIVSGVTFEDASAGVVGLGPGQTAWVATSGTYTGALVRVEILRLPSVDLNNDGTPDIVHLQVNGAVIDVNNVVQVTSDGEEKAIPTKKPGLMLSAVAEGTKTMDGFVQEQRDECLERLVTLMTQMAIFESIPSV